MSHCKTEIQYRTSNKLVDTVNKLIVWGVGTTRTLRVHWMLHELEIEYETRAIGPRTGETQTEEFKSLNPKQKIPALIDGDLVVTESAAIMRHLRRICDRLPYDQYQQSVAGLAEYDEWLSFMLMELDATSLYVVRRHGDLSGIYGEAENAVTSSIAYFERMLNSVVDRVADKEFIWGTTFSELDIHMAILLDWGGYVGAGIPDRLSDYHDRIKSRPAYKTASELNFSA